MEDGEVTVVVPSLGRMQQRWTDQPPMLPGGLLNLSFMLGWQRESLYRSVLLYNKDCYDFNGSIEAKMNSMAIIKAIINVNAH